MEKLCRWCQAAPTKWTFCSKKCGERFWASNYYYKIRKPQREKEKLEGKRPKRPRPQKKKGIDWELKEKQKAILEKYRALKRVIIPQKFILRNWKDEQ